MHSADLDSALDGTWYTFGKTNSPAAFGHNGAGGMIAWADSATGLSFSYLTNGLDDNLVRQKRAP